MLNAVIDLSHHNDIHDIKAFSNSGILGVFHKATQGITFVDPTFTSHRKKIESLEILFGAYHFGTAGDASAQAEHFISIAGKNIPLVLDFEPNPQGKDMSLEEAEEFVHHIYHETGRYPGLYSGHTIKEALLKAGLQAVKDTELAKCWLWIAQYGTAPLIPPIWQKWTFWQYTDGAHGKPPFDVPGIGRCDRNLFSGDIQALRDFWAAHSVANH